MDINLNNLNIDNFIEMLYDVDITIYENIDGHIFKFKFIDDKVYLYDKYNTPIILDKSNYTFYNDILNHLENIDDRVKSLCNNIYFMCSIVEQAKNSLILLSYDDKITIDDILEYADVLDISPLPVLYYGKLSNEQLDIIKKFLNTSEKDLLYIFDNDNFASFFYKLLNPSYKNSILGDNFDINKLSLIIDDNNIKLNILNPFYDKQNNDTNYSEIINLLIVNFLSYLQTQDIERRLLSGNDSDTIYIKLMGELFLDYIDNNDVISNFNITYPIFYNEKYNFNIEQVYNNTLKQLLINNDDYFTLFKILICSFKYNITETNDIITDNVKSIYNDYINKINNVINRALNIYKEDELSKSGLIDFDNFFKIKYPSPDGNGQYYFNDIEKNIKSNDNKKKKKLI